MQKCLLLIGVFFLVVLSIDAQKISFIGFFNTTGENIQKGMISEERIVLNEIQTIARSLETYGYDFDGHAIYDGLNCNIYRQGTGSVSRRNLPTTQTQNRLSGTSPSSLFLLSLVESEKNFQTTIYTGEAHKREGKQRCCDKSYGNSFHSLWNICKLLLLTKSCKENQGKAKA